MQIAAAHGYSDLVLGARGRGAFGNDPHATAADFRAALAGPFDGAFDQVVFAITDWSPERRFLGRATPSREGEIKRPGHQTRSGSPVPLNRRCLRTSVHDMARGIRSSVLALLALGTMLGFTASCSPADSRSTSRPSGASMAPMALPAPRTDGPMSVEEALSRRRSVRAYAPGSLRIDEVSQLLWAAQGVTSASGGRTAPSAGALYPLEVLLVAGDVEGFTPGVYRYRPARHALTAVTAGDVRERLADAALGQESVRAGSASLVIAGVYARTTGKYGNRGRRFVDMEAGHAAQNVCLQAVASGLGTVTIGALSEEAVRQVLGLSEDVTPLYVLPVGRTE